MTVHAVANREAARHPNGQFGAQPHTAPELTIIADDPREGALQRLGAILDGHPDLYAHAEDFIRSKIAHTWKPDLIFIDRGDKLMSEQMDAYLTGDEEPLDSIYEMFQDDSAYWDQVNEYASDLLGEGQINDLDEDTQEQLREWIREYDHSAVIPDLVRGNGRQLIQLPAVADDSAFGEALSAATRTGTEEERFAAAEKVFYQVLTDAGIELTGRNKEAVEELVAENSLDDSHQMPEQWHVRIVAYTDPAPLAMSSYAEHGSTPRKVQVSQPSLLLVDPHNGRAHDVMLDGTYTTALSPDRPARLDEVLGYGSLDHIAGVHRPAYDSDITVEVSA